MSFLYHNYCKEWTLIFMFINLWNYAHWVFWFKNMCCFIRKQLVFYPKPPFFFNSKSHLFFCFHSLKLQAQHLLGFLLSHPKKKKKKNALTAIQDANYSQEFKTTTTSERDFSFILDDLTTGTSFITVNGVKGKLHGRFKSIHVHYFS